MNNSEDKIKLKLAAKVARILDRIEYLSKRLESEQDDINCSVYAQEIHHLNRCKAFYIANPEMV